MLEGAVLRVAIGAAVVVSTFSDCGVAADGGEEVVVCGVGLSDGVAGVLLDGVAEISDGDVCGRAEDAGLEDAGLEDDVGAEDAGLNIAVEDTWLSSWPPQDAVPPSWTNIPTPATGSCKPLSRWNVWTSNAAPAAGRRSAVISLRCGFVYMRNTYCLPSPCSPSAPGGMYSSSGAESVAMLVPPAKEN